MDKLEVTREEWLMHAAEVIRQAVANAAGVDVPPVKVSCSWPGGGSAQKRIGECWPRQASAAGVNEIFISPKIADSAQAVSILCHELAHAVDDCKSGHGTGFVKLGKRMGLQGKPTSMSLPADLAQSWAARVTDVHGEYPHEVLDKRHSPVKPQVGRQLKVTCGDPCCGAIFRVSKKVIDMADDGLSCPVCLGPTEVEA
jgi:hypothetical protein